MTSLDGFRPDPLPGAVVRQNSFDVIIGKCVVSDRNLARAVFIGHQTVSDGEARVCLLPYKLFCPTVALQCLVADRSRFC